MEAPASSGPTFFPKKVGGKKGQGGEFRFSPPCTHPLKRPIRGACGPRVKEDLISFWLKHATGMFLNAKTYWMYPPSCSTGSLPAAKAYFVTPPPLGGNTVGRGILDAPFPSRHKHRGISEAWHRRRPGGPSRYNATTFRACRVIPMRVTRGAASSAQATDRSLPGRPESSFPPLGLLSPPNPLLRWASSPHRTRFAGLRRGPQLPQAPANGTGGNAGPVFALFIQPTAAMDSGSRARRPWWFSRRF